MSATRQRFNRFPPKDTIEWLDHDQRRSHRATIAMLTDLALTLEKGGELTPQQEAFILNRTAGSIARDTRLNAAWDMQEKTEEAYLAKLAVMAPHDLTAYHELINPHEPPAHHHRFVCEHLMRVERGDLRTLIIALPPGAAKAASTRTIVKTSNGNKTLGEIVVGDEVMTLEGRAKPVVEVIERPDEEEWILKLADGTEIGASPDHSWPTARGHVQTQDLTDRDIILKPRVWEDLTDCDDSFDIDAEVSRLCDGIVHGSNFNAHVNYSVDSRVYTLSRVRLLDFLRLFTERRLTEYTRENGKSTRREISHPSESVIRIFWELLARVGVHTSKPRYKSEGSVTNKLTLPEDAYAALYSDTVEYAHEGVVQRFGKWDAIIAGLMTGDGSSASGAGTFHNGDPSIISLFYEVMKTDFGIELKHYLNVSGAVEGGDPCGILRGTVEFRDWLQARDLWGRKFDAKRVPQWVKDAPPEVIAYFLSGAFMTDGTLYLRQPNPGRHSCAIHCNISHANKELVKDYVELFAKIGIKARCLTRSTTYNGEPYAYWSCKLKTKEDIVKFFQRGLIVGFKRDRFNEYFRAGHLPSIPPDDKYVGIRVASATPTGKRVQMRCLRVKDDATFLVETGVATCNSTYSSRTFAQWALGRNPDWRVLAVGHALALDTEVPTPEGFKTVSEIAVGDYVYAPDGTPTKVIDKSPVYRDHACYKVTTSDGASVVVDENHKWTIQGYKTPKTTGELSRMKSAKVLPRQDAVAYPHADLPIDPYILGFWLGDGDSHGARITCGKQDVAYCVEQFTSLGYPTKESVSNPHRVSLSNLHTALNAAGLLKNKHIPESYKTASIEQRVSLVQGLMDADGDANSGGHTLCFSNTNLEIIKAFREILWSLGIKNTQVTIPAVRKVIAGKEYACATSYRVHFLFDQAFRIPRKDCRRNGVKSRLIHVVPHESVPTQCITVEHPSHLFLVTRGYIPTHNSQKFVEDEFSKPNRTAIDSDAFRLAFPDVALNPAEKSASFWRLDGWRGSYACRGALAGTSGLRAKIVLADDLFKNAQDAMSSVVRENIWRWWTADVMSRRLPNAPTVLVNCLTAETPVLRGDGSWTPISELKVGDDLWTYDKETGEPSVQVVEHWAEQPEDKIYEVHTGNGMVRCNGKHPFWARKYRYKGKWDDPCWINAEDLCVSDKVLHGGQREGSSEARLTEDEAWVLGLFFGDGCVSTGKGRAPWFCDQYITRLSVSNKPYDQQYIQQRINATFGVDFRFVEQKTAGGTSARFETNTVRTAKWLDAHGVKIAGSAHTKRVPEWMFDQPRVIRQAFVDGLIHADGHRASSGQVSITLCNEGLIRDLRTLLVGLGIKATTARRYEQYSTLPGRKEKYHSVRYRVTYRDGNTYSDAFYWKGVTKVVDTKTREKVYDIQVSKTHNFVADHIVVSNTLWHSEDIPGRMKRLYEDNPKSVPLPFEFINIPAQAGTDDPLGREEGEWLWCVDQQEDGFYTITDYLTKRSMTTPAMWSALYQGEPLDQQGEYIHEDQFQRYDRPPVNREGRKIEWTKTVMSVDCASKGKERSDYTAILIFRQGVDGLHYLVDVWRQKEPLETIIRTMSRMMRHWQVNYAIVEDSGMGAQILENYAGKMPSPMLPYVPAGKGSKDFRFDAAVPWITSGKILFPKNAPWLIEFINELVAFPNAANDDQADAFSQYTANELKFRKGGTRPLKVRI